MTTRDGKQTISPPMLIGDDDVHEEMIQTKDAQTKDARAKNRLSDAAVTPQKWKLIPRTPPPFPQGLKIKEEESKFQYFNSILE